MNMSLKLVVGIMTGNVKRYFMPILAQRNCIILPCKVLPTFSVYSGASSQCSLTKYATVIPKLPKNGGKQHKSRSELYTLVTKTEGRKHL